MATIAALAAITYVATGARYASYSPHRSGNYLWGVYHVHSNMSDGLQSPEDIAAQARASGISLVLLTDHGTPNLESSSFHKIIDGVTIVGGSEATLPDGHFTFFGARETPGFRLSSFPPEAMDNARQWGAFPVLAYPEDPQYAWRYWNTDLKPGGIELLNLFTSLRGVSWAGRFRLAMYYPFSRYYFLKDIVVPRESIAHWDDFLERGKLWGFVASDAHGGFHVAGLSIKLPSYSDTFSLAGMGIAKRYESDPEAAIRSGDFFNCIRGAGEPERFEFFARRGFQEFSTWQRRAGGLQPACGSANRESSGSLGIEEGWRGDPRDRRRSPGPRESRRRRLSRRGFPGSAPTAAIGRAVDSFEPNFRGGRA